MILTAKEIVKSIDSGAVVISPFDKKQLGTASYKFRINNKISPIYGPLDSKKPQTLQYEDMPETGYVLEPGVLYLAQTYEVMGAHNHAQQVFALRDVGSAGIFIHISADLGHSGAITQWTLEITTDHKVTLYPYQFIGQIVFWQTEGQAVTYNGDYQNMQQSLPGKQWKEFLE